MPTRLRDLANAQASQAQDRPCRDGILKIWLQRRGLKFASGVEATRHVRAAFEPCAGRVIVCDSVIVVGGGVRLGPSSGMRPI